MTARLLLVAFLRTKHTFIRVVDATFTLVFAPLLPKVTTFSPLADSAEDADLLLLSVSTQSKLTSVHQFISQSRRKNAGNCEVESIGGMRNLETTTEERDMHPLEGLEVIRDN
jgi:hypothetical protein